MIISTATSPSPGASAAHETDLRGPVSPVSCTFFSEAASSAFVKKKGEVTVGNGGCR